MVHQTGNIIQLPGQTAPLATVKDEEILSSYSRLNQKGLTLQATASTTWPTGTLLKVSGVAKKYTGAAKAFATPVGFLRKGVDVSDGVDCLANVVLGGCIKGKLISTSDAAAGTLTVLELQTIATNLKGRYDVVHDQLIF